MAQQAKAGDKTRLQRDLKENTTRLQKMLGIGESFDVLLKEFEIGGVKAALLFVDGLTNDAIFTLILEHLADLKREEVTLNTLRKLFYRHLPYTEISQMDTLEEVVEKVLSGPQALLVDGEESALIIDARIYPVRQPEEPDLERVVRGSRDGFTETLVYNTALIRRRLRDPRLRMELMQAGSRSKTDIVVCFLQDVANPDLVDSVKEKIRNINIDGLPMAEKAVEELITPGSFWNPFPRVRYTERPDVAAMHLLEGHVLILVDTSPSVIILPATYFHHLQHAEEYRQSPAVGVWLRMVRFVGVAASLFLLPLWFLAATHPEILPPALGFIGPKKPSAIPLIGQFVIAEFAVDMVRLATIHTPTGLTTAISIVAALLIGEIAVNVGLFAPEVILYATVAALGTFLTPSYELSMANRLVRFFLLLVTALAGVPGFILGTVGMVVFLTATKSFGVPYLWPLIPFNWAAMKKVLVRSPVPIDNIRPSILKPKDKYRQAVPEPARKR